jgi:hypothetical protein
MADGGGLGWGNDEVWQLVAADLVTGMRWIDFRKFQDPSRKLGPALTAVHGAFRQVAPLQRAQPTQPAWPRSPS